MAAPPLTQTANDIITSALRLCHVLAAGETPQAEESQDGLAVLNQMIDAWQIDRLMIFTVNITDFPFQAGKQTYTLGQGGDFNIPRPARIEEASIVLLANPTNPLELSMYYTLDESEWQGILLKQVQSTFPQFVYDDGNVPFRTLSFWPIPREVNNFRLYSWAALQNLPALESQANFPPGYAEAVRYNLALRLADEFGGQLGPNVATTAQQALAKIKTFNVPINKLACDDAFVGGGTSAARVRQDLFGIP